MLCLTRCEGRRISRCRAGAHGEAIDGSDGDLRHGMAEPADFLAASNAVDLFFNEDGTAYTGGHPSYVAAGAKGAALAGNHNAADLGVHGPLAKADFNG